MERFPCVLDREGFTLVETMAAVLLLALVALMVFAGIQSLVGISQKGKLKAEGVALLKAATEDISANPSALESVAGKGEQIHSLEAIGAGESYEARYEVADTGYGVYRLEVRVIRDGNQIASNSMLIQTASPKF